jgi:excisionase family DNA binding protein
MNPHSSHQNGMVRPVKRLYSVDEARLYLGVSMWTVRAYVSNGKLPVVRVGRRILLDIHDLDSFIERSKFHEEQW